MENNKNYMKGFVPYAIAAAILSLCGGFTASVPTAISTAWDADSSLTFITLAYSLAAAAMALADPTSAWQPPSAPAVVAFRVMR